MNRNLSNQLLGDTTQPQYTFGGPDAPGKDITPFLSVENGAITSSPLGGDQVLPATKLIDLIRSSENRTIFAPQVDTQVEAGGAATVSIDIADIVANPNNGGRIITSAYIPFFLLQISAPSLNNLPAGQISITPTVSYENHGSVSLGEIVVAQMNVANRINLTIVPWIICQSKPRPSLANIRAGNSLSAALTGLATGAQVTLIVPGTTHRSIQDTLKRLGAV